jgi:hypothetical protein
MHVTREADLIFQSRRISLSSSLFSDAYGIKAPNAAPFRDGNGVCTRRGISNETGIEVETMFSWISCKVLES